MFVPAILSVFYRCCFPWTQRLQRDAAMQQERCIFARSQLPSKCDDVTMLALPQHVQAQLIARKYAYARWDKDKAFAMA